MKQDALDKLIGLELFQVMFFSKANFSNRASDQELQDGFRTRFKTSLPIKYFDIVLVQDLAPKPPTPEEASADTPGDGEGTQ